MGRVVRKDGPAKKPLSVILNFDSDMVGKVGWFETSKYPDGTPVAYVATIQEFGSAGNNIPPRPFMRTTIAEKQDTWRTLAARGVRAVMAGTINIFGVLDQLGQQARGDIQKKISQITSPPLKDSTLRARASRYKTATPDSVSRKPLVDTGVMLQSIQNTVEAK